MLIFGKNFLVFFFFFLYNFFFFFFFWGGGGGGARLNFSWCSLLLFLVPLGKVELTHRMLSCVKICWKAFC